MEETPTQGQEIMKESSNKEGFETLWCWKPIDSENWTNYLPKINKLIEEAHKQNIEKINIGESWISFKEMLQYNCKDNQISAYVKRQIIRETKRFTDDLPRMKTVNEPFGNMRHFFLFLRTKASLSDIKNIQFLPKDLEADIENIEEVAELVIDSLEAESIRAKALKQMKIISKPIKKSLSSKDKLAFKKAIIQVYTAETFLYRRVNEILRNEDWDSMDNVLPYIICFLNSMYSLNPKGKRSKTNVSWTKLFRGFPLSESMISEYEEGKMFSWDAFISATTNEDVAKCFAAENDLQSVLFTFNHWNWMHPEYDDYQQYLDEKHENEDEYNGNDVGNEDDNGSGSGSDDCDGDDIGDSLVAIMKSIHKKTGFVYPVSDNSQEKDNSENESESEGENENKEKNMSLEHKSDKKEDFVYDPYDNHTEYGSLYQMDTKEDYIGQVFSISQYSVNPDENEVIFAPGTIFKVIKKYKEDYMYCIDLKISQRYATKNNGYQQGRFWSLLGTELLKLDIKMKKKAIGLQSLTDSDMKKTVELLIQGKDSIESICLDLSTISEQAMEHFLTKLYQIPKMKALNLQCEHHTYDSICEASRALGKCLAETPVKELYITFSQETEAGFFVEKLHNWNLYKNLNILVFNVGGEEDADKIEGDEGNKIHFQRSLFSKVADSSITELQLTCGSTKLELDPEALCHLSKAKHLEKLMLAGFAINDENVAGFIHCLEQLKIINLSITLSICIERSNLQRLLEIVFNASSPLHSIHIDFRKYSRVEIDDNLATQIATGVAQSNLQILELQMINITLNNLLKLLHLFSQTNLTSLLLGIEIIDKKRRQKQLEEEELSDDEISIENSDLPKTDQLLLLASLREIIPKSKLTRFGLMGVSERLLKQELEEDLRKILELKHIEEIKSRDLLEELVFTQIPAFSDNVNDLLRKSKNITI